MSLYVIQNCITLITSSLVSFQNHLSLMSRLNSSPLCVCNFCFECVRYGLLCTLCSACCSCHANFHLNLLLEPHPWLLGRALQVTLCIILFTSRRSKQQDRFNDVKWFTTKFFMIHRCVLRVLYQLLLLLFVFCFCEWKLQLVNKKKDQHVLNTLKCESKTRLETSVTLALCLL